MRRFTILSFYTLFICLQFAGQSYADSSGLTVSTGSIAQASSKTYEANIQPGSNYTDLPTCPSTPTNCPTTVCTNPTTNSSYPALPSSCNPISCPAVCTSTRSPEVVTVVGTVNGVSYIDPATTVTLASCPPGYQVVNTYDSQMEIAYGQKGAVPSAIYPTTIAIYQAYNSIKVASGNLFTCAGGGSTYNAGRMNTCGESSDYPNGSVWAAGALGADGGTVNTAVAIITSQVWTPVCGCDGECDNTCSCDVADTPRFWNYDYQNIACQENVGTSAYVYLTGNYVPVGLVCGYQLIVR